MSHQTIYEFGAYRLDAAERLLSRDGVAVPLQPKVFDLLLVLVERHGHLLEKDELLKTVWPDAVVEEVNLANNISILRKTLAENGEPVIETVPRRGYRFIAPVRLVTPVSDASQPVAPPANRQPRLVFAAAALLVLLTMGASSIYFWLAQRRTQAAVAAIKSIAVLPVRPLHQDKNDEYLGVGLADAVITRLSSTGKIIVRPTSAITRYTAADQDPLAAGREQQVEAVLESSLWRSGEKIRLTSRLLNVSDGQPLWSYSCEEFCTDVFAVQTLISSQVAEALLPQLTGAEKGRLRKGYTQDAEANRLYLLGQYHWNRRTGEDHQKSIGYFQQAVARDPKFALAYAGMAESYYLLDAQPGDQQENLRQARLCAERALALDEMLAEAHTTLAIISCVYDWDWLGSERRFQKALALNPGYATAHQRYSLYLMKVGRTEESLQEIRQAVALDPTSLSLQASLGMRLRFARRYDESLASLRQAFELDPHRKGTLMNYGETCLQKGLHAEAVTVLRKATENTADEDVWARLGYAYAKAGQLPEARKILARFQAQRNVNPMTLVILHTGLGEKEEAFAWLEKAYQAHAQFFTFLPIDPLFDPLRTDPRYADFLRRMKLGQ